MRYNYPLFRPPSEAESLIFQITLGCSHNRCSFCSMYREKTFQIRPESQVLSEIQACGQTYPDTHRVFLADGDALVVKTDTLLRYLGALKQSFPFLRRVSIYANAKNLLNKTPEELLLLSEAGLSLIYLGLESGDSEILKTVNKGSSPEENIQGILKAKEAGIKTSVMIIAGLGGKERSKEHALASAKAVSVMNPDFFSVLTLMIPPGSILETSIREKKLTLLSAEESLQELKLMIQEVQGRGILFRSNHASNYLNLAGVLSRDREDLMAQIDRVLQSQDFKPEYFRGL